MSYINLNGKITTRDDARLPVENRAFRYGYGIFETMLIVNDTIHLSEYHWERLYAGMKQLELELPPLVTLDYLEEEVWRTVNKNKLDKLCRVRLQVYGGEGGLYEPGDRKAGYVIECFSLDEGVMHFNENGLIVGVAHGLNKSMDALCNLKSCNALIYTMAANQAREHQWNDAMVCNTLGNIIESTIANIFWIKNGTVYTPPLSEGCVAGVIRRYLMHDIPVEEKKLSVEELLLADEVFLTNAIKRMRWVSSIGDVCYKNEQTKSIYHSSFDLAE
ncbi:MAG: hypothetical protein K0Q79_2537 [Flavipsychrobacter sp.]|nr:hypothetical protein [Flavipsychrobacter sp.]